MDKARLLVELVETRRELNATKQKADNLALRLDHAEQELKLISLTVRGLKHDAL